MNRVVLNTAAIDWESGLDSLRKMTAEFRDNLGPSEKLEQTYAKRRQKTLFIDPETTRRADLVEAESGFEDLTAAYHDSVEECLLLAGHCFLIGEGDMYPSYYFWRPPGWVHATRTGEGYRAIIAFEGYSPGDGSGLVSRRIRSEREAGTNALYGNTESAVGPRGWVRHLDTELLPWQRGPAFARREGRLDGFGLERAEFKVLSKNAETGAQSLLVRLAPGYREIGPTMHLATEFFFVLRGTVAIGSQQLPESGFLYRPAGTVEEPMASEGGALLFMKVDGWLDMEVLSA
jgi:hypothetical protein